jgi:hypothetical protein
MYVCMYVCVCVCVCLRALCVYVRIYVFDGQMVILVAIYNFRMIRNWKHTEKTKGTVASLNLLT